MAKFVNPTKVITGVNTRWSYAWSYANVWDPKSINGGTPKYSVSLIIPKSDTVTINKIKAAIQAAYEEGQSKLKGNSKSVPALSTLKTPLRDGDLERPDDPVYANAYFINANSSTAPGIVDADRQQIKRLFHQRQLFHSARYCRRRQTADHRPFRSIFRRVRQSQHQSVCLQHQREQRRRSATANLLAESPGLRMISILKTMMIS